MLQGAARTGRGLWISLGMVLLACGERSQSTASPPALQADAAAASADGGTSSDGSHSDAGLRDGGSSCSIAAEAAKSVVTQYCYSCHGWNGSSSGGLDNVLDVPALVASGRVNLENVDDSRILVRASSGTMPPPGIVPRPNEDDIAALRTWILCGAQEFDVGRAHLDDDLVFDVIRSDLGTMSPDQRRSTRYLSLVHLYNDGASAEDLAGYQEAVNKVLASLSWDPHVSRVEPIGVGGTGGLLLKVDIADLDWDIRPTSGLPRQMDGWEQVLRFYPYGVTLPGDLVAETSSRLPLVHADWFVNAAARPPLYHELLEIPEQLDEFLRLFSVDIRGNVIGGNVMRAGFNGSGVSQYNRLIERHEVQAGWEGACWTSYDFRSNIGQANLFEHPTNHIGEQTRHFEFAGGETICNLPNGAQAYLLSDASGRRIDKGPTSIVQDDRDPQLDPEQAVVNGVSCMRCHDQGIIQKGDQIRMVVDAAPQKYSPEEVDYVRAVHPSTGIENLQRSDAERFLDAMLEVGVNLERGVEPVAALAYANGRDVSRSRAAAELGLTEEDFVALAEQIDGFPPALGPFRSGAAVPRDVWSAEVSDFICRAGLGPCDPDGCGQSAVPCLMGEICVKSGSLVGGCRTPTCGDEVVDEDEGCDDGNAIHEDGCSPTCVSEVCGDGVVQPGLGEQCDPPSGAGGIAGCDAECKLQTCGDGAAQEAEQCDDGNAIPGDGCSDVCMLEYCGDGIAQTSLGEACDDRNRVTDDGCEPDCRFSYPVLSAGHWFTCGLSESGEAHCWGDNSKAQAMAPAGIFSEISAGARHACAVESQGVVCWGDDTAYDGTFVGQTQAPDRSLRGIAAGWEHTCGLERDGKVTCWGRGTEGELDAPSGAFAQVCSGAYHSCALSNEGTVRCWGSNVEGDVFAGQASPPGGLPLLQQISCGAAHTCALSVEGDVRCWGRLEGTPFGSNNLDPGTQHRRVTSGDQGLCVERSDGPQVCFGSFEGGLAAERGIALRSHSCGLSADNQVVCSESSVQAPIPLLGLPLPITSPRRVSAITEESTGLALGLSRCSRTSSDGFFCFDQSMDVVTISSVGQSLVFPGAMGLSEGDGALYYLDFRWFPVAFGFVPVDLEVPGDYFSNISSGFTDVCGATWGNGVICWGGGTVEQLTPSSNSLADVRVGTNFACGGAPATLDGDTSLRDFVCWGSEAPVGSEVEGQVGVRPSVIATSFDVGAKHACAMVSESELTCWGDNAVGQSLVPPGYLSGPSLAGNYSCAVRHETLGDHFGLGGDAMCWGDTPAPVPAALEGRVTEVFALPTNTCARLVSGDVVCWGRHDVVFASL